MNHTLISRGGSPTAPALDVIVDLPLKSTKDTPDELRDWIAECKKTNCKLALIRRQFEADMYITYEAGAEAAIELALITALCSPQSTVNVEQASGGTAWDKY